MALSTKTGTLTQPNATTGNQAITGLGFIPKVVLLWSTGTITTTTLTAHAQISEGIAVAAGDQRVVAACSQDASGAPKTGRKALDTACILFLDPNSSTQAALAQAALVSMDSDGFTINWSVCDAVQRRVHWLALGGSDITQVAGGTTPSPTSAVSPSNAVPVSLGWAPDLVLFLPTNLNTFPGNSTNSGFGFGVAARDGQAGVGTNAVTGTVPTTAGRYQRADKAVVGFGYPVGVQTLNLEANVSSFDSTGFTLTYDAVSTQPIQVEYVAIAGVQAHVETRTAPATSGTENVRGLAFTPQALLAFGHNGQAATTIAASQHVILGAATGSASQRSAYMGNANNANPSIAKSYSDAANIINAFVETPSPSGTQSAIANLSALVSGGWDLSWTIQAGDVSTHQYAFLAIGPAVPTTNPTGLAVVSQGTEDGLSGTLSAPIEVLLTPGNAGIASGQQLYVTLSIDEYPDAVFVPGTVLTLSHSTLAGLFAFTIPTISGTVDQVVTLRATATGVDGATLSGTLAYTIHPAATGISLSGPTTGPAGEQSDVFTVTLTGGTGTAEEIAVTPTIAGGTGYAVPGVVFLGGGVTSATFRVVVEGADTVTVGLTNVDGLTVTPATITYTTTLPADYTINAPLTVPAGYKTTRIRVALRSGLTLSNPLPVALYDDQTGSDQGTWYLDLDDTPLTPASDGKARITLTQTTRFVDVQYKAASTKGVGVVDTVHLSVLADTPGFGAPASVPLDVYDPAVFYAINIAATYPGFPGDAGSVTYTVLDDSQVAIYSNPTGRVWAGDTDGKYLSTIIMRLESGGSVTWTEPPGWTGGAAQYEFDAPRAVGPVLSALDLGSVTTELQRSGGGVRLASFASMGITTFTAAQVRSDPNYLLMMLVSALVNKPEKDGDGNLLYKANDGTTVLLTIPTNDDGAVFSLGEPV